MLSTMQSYVFLFMSASKVNLFSFLHVKRSSQTPSKAVNIPSLFDPWEKEETVETFPGTRSVPINSERGCFFLSDRDLVA